MLRRCFVFFVLVGVALAATPAQLQNSEDVLRVRARKLTARDIPLLKQKVAAGNAVSQWMLAHAYQAGTGIPKNEAEALKLYQKAADKGLSVAQVDLGTFYHSGQLGVSKDDGEAMRWFQ